MLELPHYFRHRTTGRIGMVFDVLKPNRAGEVLRVCKFLPIGEDDVRLRGSEVEPLLEIEIDHSVRPARVSRVQRVDGTWENVADGLREPGDGGADSEGGPVPEVRVRGAGGGED